MTRIFCSTSGIVRPYCGFAFFFSSRRRHTRLQGDWSSDVCSSDLRARSPEKRPARLPTTRLNARRLQWAAAAASIAAAARRAAAAAIDKKSAVPGKRSDRKSVVEGKRGDLGGRRIIKKKKDEG